MKMCSFRMKVGSRDSACIYMYCTIARVTSWYRTMSRPVFVYKNMTQLDVCATSLINFMYQLMSYCPGNASKVMLCSIVD